MDTDPINLTGAKILLVDDTPANLDVLITLLEAKGYKILIAASGAKGIELAQKAVPDLILLDVRMPGMDGYEMCRRLKQMVKTAMVPVIFITAYDSTEGLMAGFQVGGVDYITKPFQEQEVLARVQTHLRLHRLTQALRQKNLQLEQEIHQRQALTNQRSELSRQEAERWGLEGFVGRSPTIQPIFKDIRDLQDTTINVLIIGESGTGKELIARALHHSSPKRDGPFVPVNCSALPGELAESHLFGHVKGAFTGADTDRVGYFEAAADGTLFLDEIGEMPLELQPKLLRVLEDRQIQRVGESLSRKIDMRIIAATNVDLEKAAQAGSFRPDLFFRLARFTVSLPPLRDRQEDIPLLAHHFLARFASEMRRDSPIFTPEAVAALKAYRFPGNVRELRNLVERALLESNGRNIEVKHLRFLASGKVPNTLSPQTAGLADQPPFDLEGTELWAIKRALVHTEGNVTKATQLLKTNRNRVYRALNREKEN